MAPDWVTLPAVVIVTAAPSSPAMATPSLSLKSMPRPVLVIVRVPTSLVADASETDPAVAATERVFATIGFASWVSDPPTESVNVPVVAPISARSSLSVNVSEPLGFETHSSFTSFAGFLSDTTAPVPVTFSRLTTIGESTARVPTASIVSVPL